MSSPSGYPVSSAPAPVRWLLLLSAALLIGVCAGAWTASDALLNHAVLSWLKFGFALRWIPYTVSLLTITLLLAVLWLALHQERAWRSRTLSAVVLVMIASHMGGIGGGLLNVLMLAILLLATVWVLHRTTTPSAPWAPTPFLWVSLLLMCAALLSMLGRHPSEVFSGFAAFAAKFALMLLLVDLLEDVRSARAAVYVMLAVAAFFSLLGIAQVFIFMTFGIDYSLSDIDYRFGQSLFGPSLRASGLSRTANQYAPPLVAAAVMALSLALSMRRTLPRLALLLLFFTALVAVMLSIVRGSWFALALGIAVLPFIHRPGYGFHWAGLALLGATAGYASGLVTMVTDTIVGLSAAGTAERWELLVAGINVMFESWNGAGIQNFSQYSPSFERYPVHNLFGQMASELGFPGLVAISALIGYVALHLVQAIRATRDPAHRSLLRAVLGGYVGLLGATQSEPMAFSQFLFIFIGVAEACARTSLAVSIANRPSARRHASGMFPVPARSPAT